MSLVKARKPSTPLPIGKTTSPLPNEKLADGATNWDKRRSDIPEGFAANRTASIARMLSITFNSPRV